MASNPEIHNTNTACCTIPPVTHEYVAKGEYSKAVGIQDIVTDDVDAFGFERSYDVGPRDAETVIIGEFRISRTLHALVRRVVCPIACTIV